MQAKHANPIWLSVCLCSMEMGHSGSSRNLFDTRKKQGHLLQRNYKRNGGPLHLLLDRCVNEDNRFVIPLLNQRGAVLEKKSRDQPVYIGFSFAECDGGKDFLSLHRTLCKSDPAQNTGDPLGRGWVELGDDVGQNLTVAGARIQLDRGQSRPKIRWRHC